MQTIYNKEKASTFSFAVFLYLLLSSIDTLSVTSLLCGCYVNLVYSVERKEKWGLGQCVGFPSGVAKEPVERMLLSPRAHHCRVHSVFDLSVL